MEIPEWFEKFRVDDNALEQSYEATPAACRAAIKTGIAISHFHYGDTDTVTSHLRVSSRLGLVAHQSVRPADWTLLFIGEDVKAAARICALAILPRLCGVGEIYAVIAGKASQAALVTLELCGVEDVFAASLLECDKILQYAATLGGPFGRICFLHEGKLARLAHASHALSGAVANLGRKPALLLTEPKDFDKKRLEFCQGKKIETRPGQGRLWDAIFTADSLESEQYVSRMFLAPGCEGFWSFKELGPDFYHESSFSAAMANSDPGFATN